MDDKKKYIINIVVCVFIFCVASYLLCVYYTSGQGRLGDAKDELHTARDAVATVAKGIDGTTDRVDRIERSVELSRQYSDELSAGVDELEEDNQLTTERIEDARVRTEDCERRVRAIQEGLNCGEQFSRQNREIFRRYEQADKEVQDAESSVADNSSNYSRCGVKLTR